MQILSVELRDDPDTATDAQYKQGILDEMKFFLAFLKRKGGGHHTCEEETVRRLFTDLYPEIYEGLRRGRQFDRDTYFLDVARNIRMRRDQAHWLGDCACMRTEPPPH